MVITIFTLNFSYVRYYIWDSFHVIFPEYTKFIIIFGKPSLTISPAVCAWYIIQLKNICFSFNVYSHVHIPPSCFTDHPDVVLYGCPNMTFITFLTYTVFNKISGCSVVILYAFEISHLLLYTYYGKNRCRFIRKDKNQIGDSVTNCFVLQYFYDVMAIVIYW